MLAILVSHGKSHKGFALFDSGSDQNLISVSKVKDLNLLMYSLDNLLAIRALDGTPMSVITH